MRFVGGLELCLVLTLGAVGCKCAGTPDRPDASARRDEESSTEVAVRPEEDAPPIPAPPDVAAPPSDAVRTPSGLATKELAPGSGKTHPTPADRVRIHYTGWKKDGTMFDSTVRRGAPATLELARAIPGFREAIPLMLEGERRRLWVPAALAYGERATLAGQPGGDLVFDLELLAVVKAPVTPKDLKRPAGVTSTPSGLAYKRLRAGNGTEHPSSRSRVRVSYTGWTEDGTLFDSSVVRGAPASIAVRDAIRGWAEGLELMVVGDTMRLWIPAALAYGKVSPRPGAPAGNLVFDVELLAIE